jgi:hypothetical protein
VLRLLLKIVLGWFSLSLLCGLLWVLLLELARRSARQASRLIGASTQTLSEEKVDALLSTPRSSNPAQQPRSHPIVEWGVTEYRFR